MIYNRYGRYRDGLYEEREEILAYMGADALLADELNAFRAAGVRKVEEKAPVVNRKATILNPKFSVTISVTKRASFLTTIHWNQGSK